VAEAIQDIEFRAVSEAGLRRVSPEDLPVRRIGRPGSFRYAQDEGAVSRACLARIKALTIPPAWSGVRIARDPQAHIQAIGRDEAGRLQYIYHSAWEDVRSEVKLYRVLQLGKSLGRIRAAVTDELSKRAPNWPMAAAIRLIDLTHLRAGHEGYAGDEGGRGVATLLKRHLTFVDGGIRLRFRGKGSKLIDMTCTDPELCAALKELFAVRGSRLFKIAAERGYRPITATMLNQYLAEIAGRPVSAKDFRTFHASSKAIALLACDSAQTATARKRSIAAAARGIAADLANTPTIVRKSYIHSAIIDTFQSAGNSFDTQGRKRAGLTKSESMLVRFLEQTSRLGSAR
jgi:DNA topoisomerase-1